MTLRHEDGDDDSQPPPMGRRDRRRVSLGGGDKKRGLERRRSRRASLGRSGHASPCSPASPQRAGFHPFNGQRAEDVSERWEKKMSDSVIGRSKKYHNTAEGKRSWVSRYKEWLWCQNHHFWDAHLLTELKREVLTVLYQHFLLQSTVRFPSIHVSSKVSQKKVSCWPLWPSTYVFLPLLLTYML